MNQITEESQPGLTEHKKAYYKSKYTNTTAFTPTHAVSYGIIANLSERIQHKKHVVVCGLNKRTGLYLVYVLSGDIQMDAIVDMTDKNLELFIPEEWIETGNSLAWLTKADLIAPNMYAEDAIEDHSFAFPI